MSEEVNLDDLVSFDARELDGPIEQVRTPLQVRWWVIRQFTVTAAASGGYAAVVSQFAHLGMFAWMTPVMTVTIAAGFSAWQVLRVRKSRKQLVETYGVALFTGELMTKKTGLLVLAAADEVRAVEAAVAGFDAESVKTAAHHIWKRLAHQIRAEIDAVQAEDRRRVLEVRKQLRQLAKDAAKLKDAANRLRAERESPVVGGLTYQEMLEAALSDLDDEREAHAAGRREIQMLVNKAKQTRES